VRDTVEELSDGQTKKTNQWSEEIAEKTSKYADNILEGTIPFSQSVSDICLNSAVMMSDKLYSFPIQNPPNSNDEFSNNISSRMAQYSSDMFRHFDEYSSNINQKTDPIFDDISSKSIHMAEESIIKNNEKVDQVLSQIDDVRSKMKTYVPVEYQVLSNNTTDVENVVDSLSAKTLDRMSNIADDIARNIMSI